MLTNTVYDFLNTIYFHFSFSLPLCDPGSGWSSCSHIFPLTLCAPSSCAQFMDFFSLFHTLTVSKSVLPSSFTESPSFPLTSSFLLLFAVFGLDLLHPNKLLSTVIYQSSAQQVKPLTYLFCSFRLYFLGKDLIQYITGALDDKMTVLPQSNKKSNTFLLGAASYLPLTSYLLPYALCLILNPRFAGCIN